MKGETCATAEDILLIDINKMELHTDDEKVRASIAKDTVSGFLSSDTSLKTLTGVTMTDVEMTKNCPAGDSPVHEVSEPDPTPPNMPEIQVLGRQPLSEETLQRSGVDLTADIPMIDDDEEDGTCIDEAVPDNPGNSGNPPLPLSADIVSALLHLTGDSPSKAVSKVLTSEDCAANVDVSTIPAEGSKGTAPVVLKSALKKSRTKGKKGHRVTFHDSRIFYIDTEAETTAEPQLLTVRSLDLPLASADYKVVIPTYEFLPSLPRESGRSYTYEDAIVSMQGYGEDNISNERNKSADERGAEEERPDGAEEVVAAVENNKIEAVPVVSVKSGEEAQDVGVENDVGGQVEPIVQPVQCLTEANLRQHEILMEQDDVQDGVVARGNEAPSTPAPEISAPPPVPIVKNLSPPLKELTVDVSAISTSANVGADWQVELSPLNSIPESETDSSTSSQDTIIMMTSEESRRNEEHIQLSTKSYQQNRQEETKTNDAASTVSSQDSDETLKCDETAEPGYIPAWKRAQLTDLEGGYGEFNGANLTQRTNSQIRQLMERNAVRRSLLRYSNTKKKAPEDTPTIEKQRQWRSHESLLDTIKQLTVEDEEEDNGDYEEIVINDGNNNTNSQPAPHVNGYRNANNFSSKDLHSAKERAASNLSLQEIQSLIASPGNIEQVMQRRSQSTTNVDVPGDIRQWKIQSTRWNNLRKQNAENGGAGESTTAPVNGYRFRDRLAPAINGKETNHSLPSCLQDARATSDCEADETGDELAQFVEQDGERIERLRKRYSYSDSGDYEMIGAFARRSSVRGIKPRFGSTSEILKQMQSQLQQSPLANMANGRSHMTWPYPVTNNNNNNNNHHEMAPPNGTSKPPRHSMTIRTTVTSRSTNSLPSLKEEIYGTVAAHRASYTAPSDARTYGRPREPIYATLPQGSRSTPPPYHPPPPAPPSSNQQNSFQYLYYHHHHPSSQTMAANPQPRFHSKDERGVPEGASGSPKVAFDSIYGRTLAAQQQQQQQHSNVSSTNKNHRQVPSTAADNSGVVYYVMQV